MKSKKSLAFGENESNSPLSNSVLLRLNFILSLLILPKIKLTFRLTIFSFDPSRPLLFLVKVFTKYGASADLSNHYKRTKQNSGKARAIHMSSEQVYHDDFNDTLVLPTPITNSNLPTYVAG